MIIHKDAYRKVPDKQIERINAISETTISLYEEILGVPYGSAPEIHICDIDSYVRMNKLWEMQYLLKTYEKSEAEKKFSERKKDIEAGAIFRYSNTGAGYMPFLHIVILQDDRFHDTDFPLVLSHELFHGHEGCRKYYPSIEKLKGEERDIADCLLEGLADYMAYSISKSLRTKSVISKIEFKEKDCEIKKLRQIYPTDIINRTGPTLQIHVYKAAARSFGYFYVEKKMNEGLPIQDILTLLENRPASLHEMWREDIAK